MKPFNQLTDEERKRTPIYSGFIRNFFSGMVAVARRSYTGSRQHHPDRDTQWDRSLSFDELDAMQRHLLEYADAESRNYYEGMAEASQAVAWRAMAHAERFFGTKPCDPEYYQDIRRLREASQDLAEGAAFVPCEPYLNIPTKLSNFLWVFGKPTHGDTYLTYSTEGHGVERELHRGVAMVGPELEGLRWVLVAE